MAECHFLGVFQTVIYLLSSHSLKLQALGILLVFSAVCYILWSIGTVIYIHI